METPFEKGRWYTWPSPFHRSEDRSLLRPLLPWNAFSFAWPVRNRHRFDIPSRRTFRISHSTRLHIRSIRTEPNDFIPLLKFSSGFDSQLWFLATIQRFKHASTRWTKIQDYYFTSKWETISFSDGFTFSENHLSFQDFTVS